MNKSCHTSKRRSNPRVETSMATHDRLCLKSNIIFLKKMNYLINRSCVGNIVMSVTLLAKISKSHLDPKPLLNELLLLPPRTH